MAKKDGTKNRQGKHRHSGDEEIRRRPARRYGDILYEVKDQGRLGHDQPPRES